MFMSRSEYDSGVNTFSPEGRLFQVEYAIEATKLGSTGIGIVTTEGVVLAVEKRITSPLIVPQSIEKIFEIEHARTLIEHARVEATHHWFLYNEPISVRSCTTAVSKKALAFGDDDAESAMSRPFGVALLFAGYDEKEPKLYYLDPSGTYTSFNAKAIGSGSEGAQQALKEVYHSNMTLVEGKKHALSILKQVMEEKLDANNVEMAVVCPNQPFHLLKTEEIQEVINGIGTSETI
ncbi:Proteasome subunit alpha type-5 [Cichlidogyrus casuarinus]|uniref:Proteasome subunit alpha type n=1 Tax=Cichlidogyrus casuarinus TaxID=1844966 RepID=A0ABD2PKJ4_9PLAT